MESCEGLADWMACEGRALIFDLVEGIFIFV